MNDEKQKLGEQVQQLKQALEEIEKRLAGDEVPVAVLEDFKSAVDHIRTTVWALMSSPQGNQYEVAPHIARLRLQRAAGMFRQISSDIDTSEITVDSPELKEFHTSLKGLLDRIERLYQSGF